MDTFIDSQHSVMKLRLLFISLISFFKYLTKLSQKSRNSSIIVYLKFSNNLFISFYLMDKQWGV